MKPGPASNPTLVAVIAFLAGWIIMKLATLWTGWF